MRKVKIKKIDKDKVKEIYNKKRNDKSIEKILYTDELLEECLQTL